MSERRIRRALISVYDKTGIVDFARALVDEFGIEIISTGGTAALLKENGIPVTLVEQITGFPEMLDGRVKTLHPKIHAAILADRNNPEHMRQLGEQGIEPIDMVVVNLYPFEKTVADPNCTFEQAIEMIDIGGPCLLRAAAKNHRHVLPIVAKRSYSYVIEELAEHSNLEESGRAVLASLAVEETSKYDSAIEHYFTHRWTELRCGPSATTEPADSRVPPPEALVVRVEKVVQTRYGENPHQTAALYRMPDSPRSLCLSECRSEAPSFNNYVDADAALHLCAELSTELGRCGTGFQPVSRATRPSTLQPVDDERHTRRNLPHFQTPGKTYFVTFRLKKEDSLAPAERDIVLEACKYWHERKLQLHAVVVMPDHVHLLLTPLETQPSVWVSLGEIVHSIKRHSALTINRIRGQSGALWQDESFDRIMRNEKEYEETWNYIANNAIEKNLDEAGHYRWFWDESQGTRVAHRLETGATQTVCCLIKHTNACGVGIHLDPIDSYRRAYIGDANAAMGGVLACNLAVDQRFAAEVMESYDRWGKNVGAGGFFVEVWVAPSFDDTATKLIREHKKSWGAKVRLLSVGDMTRPPDPNELDCRRVTRGMLVQTADLVGLNEDQWKVVTQRPPSESEISDLRLAWLIAKHTKSNAISICKDGMLIGNGAGQMSRVMSCRIATWLAKENGHADKLPGSAAASDAFFPFSDGPNLLMDAGVTAIIQPGGSKRDAEVIAACDARNVAMIFTGTRHFKH